MKRNAITTGNKRLRAIAKAAEAKGHAAGHRAAIDAAYRRAREELTSFVRVEHHELRLMEPPRHRWQRYAVLPGRAFTFDDVLPLASMRDSAMVIDFEWECRVRAVQTPRGPVRVVWWSPMYHGEQLEPMR